MFDRDVLGEAITALRGRKTQRSVALSVGIATGTWCQWEKGNRTPRDHQIEKILAALDCSRDRLRLECCRIQIKRLKMKGSGLDSSAFEAFEEYRPELAECSRARLHNISAPHEVRTAVNRLQRGLQSVSKQLIRLHSDLEAVTLAIETSKGEHRLRTVSSGHPSFFGSSRSDLYSRHQISGEGDQEDEELFKSSISAAP